MSRNPNKLESGYTERGPRLRSLSKSSERSLFNQVLGSSFRSRRTAKPEWSGKMAANYESNQEELGIESTRARISMIGEENKVRNRDEERDEGALSVLELPCAVIRRIIFFVYHQEQPISKRRRMQVFNFLRTCKELYINYYYVLFDLGPITLSDSTESWWTRKQTTSDVYGAITLNSIAGKPEVKSTLKMLNVVLSNGKQWYSGNSWVHRRPEASHFRSFAVSAFDEMLTGCLKDFQALHSLGIRGSSMKILYYVNRLPPGLRTLTLYIDYDERNFNCFKDAQSIDRMFESSSSVGAIENIQIYSSKPVMQTRVHSMLCLGFSGHYITYYDQYFSHKWVSKFEKLNVQHKRGLIVFGRLLYRLLERSRLTLKSLELVNFDCALIFNSRSSQIDTLDQAQNTNLHFPSLRLLVLDNISYVRLDTWLNRLQLSNTSLRKGRSLFIAINDQLSKTLLTKTAIHMSNRYGDEGGWSYFKSPQSTLEEIKVQLDVDSY
ncbi:Piso0_002388 [Millerozyma farinosa CBS 7064]|uniref:Piso0_002388 protein n=1 Tax=Pichia sorbitophila (strain ATCC MYA-4447 / BCRC 22081 / CBS 7064 / NBRC 10061 / NRRL Y-12695) TaxID=559304 RepID=G8YCH2_PICSO|nr:Piso0_002388 [Millerozyma farinosa CBS 7064]